MDITSKITVPARKKSKPSKNKLKSSRTYSVNSFARLGREIKISPKSKVSINSPGYKVEFYTETVDIIIGIGPDNVAHLIMDINAWKALKDRANEIDITTLKKHEKEFL